MNINVGNSSIYNGYKKKADILNSDAAASEAKTPKTVKSPHTKKGDLIVKGNHIGQARRSFLECIKEGRKKELDPADIARKIAKGRRVSKEELKFLKENDPSSFRKAFAASRLRKRLEETLKSAQSDTAKARAIAIATSQAMTMGKMDAKTANGDEGAITGAELYGEAIRTAIKNEGSKALEQDYDKLLELEMPKAEQNAELQPANCLLSTYRILTF